MMLTVAVQQLSIHGQYETFFGVLFSFMEDFFAYDFRDNPFIAPYRQTDTFRSFGENWISGHSFYFEHCLDGVNASQCQR